MRSIHSKFICLAGAVVLMVAGFIGSAAAQEQRTAAQCKAAYEGCEASCNDQHTVDGVDKAQCRATCQATYAACDAAAAFEQAKPWVEEQWERTKDFIDGLLKGDTSPEPAPPADEQKI